MKRERLDQYIQIAEELANQKGGLESLEGAVTKTKELLQKGEPVSRRNLEVLENLLSLAKRAGKNPQHN